MTVRAERLVARAGLLLMVLAWVLPAPAAEEQPLTEAARMLGRMDEALRSLNYEGVLVRAHANRLESLHLMHWIDGGEVRERLVSLSGPVRAVTRDAAAVTCVMPDGHPLRVRSRGGRSLLSPGGVDPSRLGAHYTVTLEGVSRVAGRETDVVAIRPRDDLRYGYLFHVDRASGLPLKSDLLDRDGEPIEQLMFTSVTIGGADDPPPATPRDAIEGAAEAPAPEAADWTFESRPEGFELRMHDQMPGPAGAPVEHFVFSDQLSAYSLYIEHSAEEGLTGVTRVGPVHAAGRYLDGYQITAVGEVPARTVSAAVAGVRRAGAMPR